jgi:hypothetical protein
MPMNIDRIKDVLDGYLFFQSPLNFNDPFDCKIKFSVEGTPREWRKAISPPYERMGADLKSKEL